MKSFEISLVFSCVVIILFMGCAQSLVYSPSMNLSPKPLKMGQTHILAGVGQFPETRPQYSKQKTAEGGEATFRFAWSDHLSVQVKGWKDLSDNFDFSRYGTSFSLIWILNDSSKVRLALIPTGAIVFTDNACEGGGGGLLLGLWYNKFNHVDFYSVFGPAVGAKSLSSDTKQWGWGVFLNVRTAVTIGKHLTRNLELAGVKQKNEYENTDDYFLCPSLNIGYIIERSRK